MLGKQVDERLEVSSDLFHFVPAIKQLPPGALMVIRVKDTIITASTRQNKC